MFNEKDFKESSDLKAMKEAVRSERKVDEVQAAKDEIRVKEKEAELEGKTLSDKERMRLEKKVVKLEKALGEAEDFDRAHSNPTKAELEENFLESEEVRQE